MKRSPASQASRELESISSSLQQVQILLRASAAPATAQQLQPLAHARILARMTRSGLLRVKAAPAGKSESTRQYSLTSKGRRLLAAAIKHLRQLAAPRFAVEGDNDDDKN